MVAANRTASVRRSDRLTLLRDQAETDASHRVDQLLLRRLFELAPQVADVHVHHIALRIEMQIPHLLQQLSAPDDLLRAKQEVLQQLELLRAQLELLPFDLDLVFQPVQLDRSVGEELRTTGPAAAHEGTHAGQQLVELERLG